jgi:hypothetical protein
MALTLAALAGSGCGGPVYQIGGPVPTTAPVSRIAPGAGTIVQPGVQAGYGITANVGGNYRAVWTGDASASASYREFSGSIYTAGQFTSFTPGCARNACPLESGDVVSAPVLTGNGSRIDFDTIATTGIDGLDFSVSVEPVYFNLYIDGVPYPNLVSFTDGSTGQNASAPGMPFGLTTQ